MRSWRCLRSWSSWSAEAEAPKLLAFPSWADDFLDGQDSREKFVEDVFELFCNKLKRRAAVPSMTLFMLEFSTTNKSWKEEERVSRKGEAMRKYSGDLERYEFGIWI